jgi:hypothetical protein
MLEITPHMPRRFRGLCGVALFAVLTAWMVILNPTVFAAGLCGGGSSGGSIVTTTTSTSSHTILGCPTPPFDPDCVLEGMTLTCLTVELEFGPKCIGVENRDVPNELPCDCGEAPPFGTPCCVAAGTENINTNTDTTTFLCHSSTAPALAPWALGLLFAGLSALGLWRLRRRSA